MAGGTTAIQDSRPLGGNASDVVGTCTRASFEKLCHLYATHSGVPVADFLECCMWNMSTMHLSAFAYRIVGVPRFWSNWCNQYRSTTRTCLQRLGHDGDTVIAGM